MSMGGNVIVKLSTRSPSCLPVTSSTKWKQVRGSGPRQTNFKLNQSQHFIHFNTYLLRHQGIQRFVFFEYISIDL